MKAVAGYTLLVAGVFAAQGLGVGGFSKAPDNRSVAKKTQEGQKVAFNVRNVESPSVPDLPVIPFEPVQKGNDTKVIVKSLGTCPDQAAIGKKVAEAKKMAANLAPAKKTASAFNVPGPDGNRMVIFDEESQKELENAMRLLDSMKADQLKSKLQKLSITLESKGNKMPTHKSAPQAHVDPPVVIDMSGLPGA